ncbi:MAG: flagellar filament capping protein FliD [Clostridiales bacterium]|nr:flagellar filament capping protein FliD [Clostridiales bacterium]
MSININSYSSIPSRKGVSGLMSGLDTDDLVQQLTMGTRTKISKQLQNRQILSWKQQAYQGIVSQMNSFYNKYFQFSSSASSILSEKFFNASTITSSSPYISATGDTKSIENVVVKDIQELATKAGFTSSHKVSNQELVSGTVYESWNDNTIAGTSMTIGYGGKNYALSISSDFYLDSTDSDANNITKVIDELNAQLDKKPELKGKLEFGLDGDGAIKLSQIGDEPTDDLKIVSGSNNLLTSLGLYKTQDENGVSEITGAYKLEAKSLFESNRFASGKIQLNIDGAKNDSYLALKSDFRFSAEAMEKDAGGNFTVGAKALQKQELQEAYDAAISSNSAFKDKISVSINDDLEMTITSLGENGTVKVTGGDEKLLEGIGLSVAPEEQEATASVTGAIDVAKVFEAKEMQIGEVLSGTTLTVNLNGVAKKISFNESEKDQFSTVEGLKDYMQNQIDKQYGQGKVVVSQTDGKLSFTTTNSSYVFTVQSSSAGKILGENGALKMISGESNRLEYVKTLDQIKDTLATPLVADDDGKYRLNVNGKAFEFTGDTMLGDVISTINRDTEVGVTISYSSVTDQFSVMAKETGAHGRVDIEDVGNGNLAQALFGTKGDTGNGYEIKQGTDFAALMSFDGGSTFTTVNRSSNSFEIDGVTFNVTGKAEGLEEENITFKANNNVDSVVDKIKEFVKEYNNIIDQIQGKVSEKLYGLENNSKEKFLPLTDEQREKMSDKEIEKWEEKAQIGLLRNDSTLNSILSSMRGAMSAGTDEGDYLFQIGITTGEWKQGGKLVIDEEKLRKAVSEDPQKINRLFTSDSGVATKLQNVFKDAVVGSEKGVGSLVSLAGKDTVGSQGTSMISKRISEIDKAVTTLKDRLKSEETRWFNKFSALETLLARMNSQSEYLASLYQQGM